MLIINADDWGRSEAETDAAFQCYSARRITSVTAMVFMVDSERAADLAKTSELDVGLHLNFDEPFTSSCPESLVSAHHKTARFLSRNKRAQLLYNPSLRREFSYSYDKQIEEFVRLYGKPPSHLDGHHHMHLCANLLLSSMIPAGMKMRRNFSFWAGEKSRVNRAYRALVDRWLGRKYQLPDYLFDLLQCIREKTFDRVARLARSKTVELMTHPVVSEESEYLMRADFCLILNDLKTGTYSDWTPQLATNDA